MSDATTQLPFRVMFCDWFKGSLSVLYGWSPAEQPRMRTRAPTREEALEICLDEAKFIYGRVRSDVSKSMQVVEATNGARLLYNNQLAGVWFVDQDQVAGYAVIRLHMQPDGTALRDRVGVYPDETLARQAADRAGAVYHQQLRLTQPKAQLTKLAEEIRIVVDGTLLVSIYIEPEFTDPQRPASPVEAPQATPVGHLKDWAASLVDTVKMQADELGRQLPQTADQAAQTAHPSASSKILSVFASLTDASKLLEHSLEQVQSAQTDMHGTSVAAREVC